MRYLSAEDHDSVCVWGRGAGRGQVKGGGDGSNLHIYGSGGICHHPE